MFLCIKLEVVIHDAYNAPNIDIFGFFLEKRLVAHCFFLPLPTLRPCCPLCLLYKWHLSVEIRGPGDFPVGTEVGGAKSLAQGVGAVLIQAVYPLCPAGVSDTGFRDFRMTACVQGWEKWNSGFQTSWCLELENTWNASSGPSPSFYRLKTSDPEINSQGHTPN